ncbi:hypothetical protein PBY51_023883 [Eleginops maclovinus]|uniref:Uncharacterized protein n=1 Tax=Eleginops maclovinus TaxID=56733 RepID=A0AAN7X1S0_ELEMC|nr:hypothetical protein PBY51_023883 [Eleginops maclovinus]
MWPYLCPASAANSSDLHVPTVGLPQVGMTILGSIEQDTSLRRAVSLISTLCELLGSAPPHSSASSTSEENNPNSPNARRI